MLICPRCGESNPDHARFCLACGAALDPLPVRAERKFVSVVFADLVDSTGRAQGLDPEDVGALQQVYWRQLRTDLERYGGTVEKYIGDAVVGLFGAPVAHEDDPERAVRAALAIRDWAREQQGLQVRVGVATGEALVRLGAQPLAGEGMAAGDVMNVVSRVQAAASADDILVDESTYRATKRAIDYQELEPIDAKGKPAPLRVWLPLDARERFAVELAHRVRAPLVGRERELDVLRGALARADEESTPQLVTLIGVPGIGKSRLVYELRESLEAESPAVCWRQGRSLPYGDGAAFWALRDIVSAEAGILETDPADAAGEKLARAVERIASGEREWVERHLRTLVGIGRATRDSDGGEVEAFAAWRRFLEALAEERPLVLVFEDLHWAEEGVLAFIEELLEWAGRVPMLVVCTARPEFLERRRSWGAGRLNVTMLALSPLRDDETAILLDALLAGAAGEENRATLLDRVGGNPLFAEQFALLLAERGDERRLALPETVHGVIAARLDGLSQAEKRLLQNAAVFGQVFWEGAAVALDRIDRQSAAGVFHSLERKEFVHRAPRSSLPEETEYTFSHVLLRDVAYRQIPRADRAVKHERAAAWIRSLGRVEDHAETIAHHYLSALEYFRAVGTDWSRIDAPARRALVEAGERASALNAFEAAAGYYEQALALWPHDDAKRPLVSFALAEALHRRGTDTQREWLQQAREELLAIGDVERAAETEAMLAEAAWLDGNDELCLQHLERARALLRERPASASRARVLAAVARHRATPRGEHEAVVELARETLTIAEALDLTEIRADALITLGRARVFLADADGLEDIEQGLALALAANSLIVAERGYEALWLAIAIEATAEFRRLPELYEEAIRVAERLGNIHLLRSAQSAMISTQRMFGEWDDAMHAADAFIAESERAGMNPLGARLHRAYIRQARDDAAGALDDIEKSLEAETPLGAAGRGSFAVFLLVELGRLEQARTLANEMVNRYPWLVFPEFALVAADVGYLGKFRAALDALSRRRPPDIAAQAIIEGRLVEAADVLTKMGRMAAAARVRLRSAETLVAEGYRVEAREQLDKALAFYKSVGATRYIRQAEALVAASNCAQEQQHA